MMGQILGSKLFFLFLLFLTSVLGHASLWYSPWARSAGYWGAQNDCGFGSGWVDYYELEAENQKLVALGLPENYLTAMTCGLCGDDINFPIPRLREFGNSTRWPSIVYREGEVKMNAIATNPHFGYFQMRVCKNVTKEGDLDPYVSQGCFNENLLQITSVKNVVSHDDRHKNAVLFNSSRPYQFDLLTDNQNGSNIGMEFTVLLQPGIAADHVSLQFTYITGHIYWKWKSQTTYDVIHNEGQQVFRDCADARIVAANEFTFLQNNYTLTCLSQAGIGSNSYDLKLGNCSADLADMTKSPISLLLIQPWTDYVKRNASITFESNGYCLDVDRDLTTEAAGVGQYPCKTNWVENERWSTIDLGGGQVLIKNQNSGDCLTAEIKPGQTAYSMDQHICDATNGLQVWKFITHITQPPVTPPPPPYVTPPAVVTFLQNKNTSTCLSEVGVGSLALTLHPCLFNQPYLTQLHESILLVQPLTDYIKHNATIMFDANGYCLDVNGGSMGVHAGVGQWTCKGQGEDAGNQLWGFIDLDGNYVQIRNQNSQDCLTAEFHPGQVGYAIVQLVCDSTNDLQAWKIVNGSHTN